MKVHVIKKKFEPPFWVAVLFYSIVVWAVLFGWTVFFEPSIAFLLFLIVFCQIFLLGATGAI